ncbi:hypothetical protein F4810DRAFT_672306 [Camillea tinctor]|nr:hypothetical protein F4810DRAFT_672306 [Camillea tinctor]
MSAYSCLYVTLPSLNLTIVVAKNCFCINKARKYPTLLITFTYVSQSHVLWNGSQDFNCSNPRTLLDVYTCRLPNHLLVPSG